MQLTAHPQAAALPASLAGPSLAAPMIPVSGDPVTIDSGKVAGTKVGPAVKAYLGIPFATPPIRENRWRAPQPVKPWAGVLNADTPRAECYQGLRAPTINHYFGDEDAAEDCLYLNVWAPAAARQGAKLPVVVWIYGGAFNVGSASSPIYSGQPLAKKGVIYVAANNRLGLFGFLAHPDLTRESGHNASGNWGFLDQVAALQWVQRNIAAFGGDPNNVTLVGQSAGSMSINDLQASPLAKGLFRRAFGMSGSTLEGGAGAGVQLAQAEAQGVKLQQALKAASLADMRGYAPDRLTAIAQQAGVRAGPDIDGWYLPKSTQAIFDAGQQNDVAVVIGSTANDIGTEVPIRAAKSLAEYQALARQSYGDQAPALLDLFPATTDAEARARADEIGRDSGFGLGARSWARAQAATGKAPSYLFMVTRVQPFTPGVAFSDFNPATAGAYHMGDVPYFLGTYEQFNTFRRTRDWTAYDRDLSDKMQDVIVAFARTGDPSTAAVKFTPYSAAHETRVLFGDSISTETLNAPALDFLAKTPAQRPQAPPRPAAGAANPTY
jgi:para-nitrobenzyl esterase